MILRVYLISKNVKTKRFVCSWHLLRQERPGFGYLERSCYA